MNVFVFICIVFVMSIIVHVGYVIYRWGEFDGIYGKYDFEDIVLTLFLHLVAYLLIIFAMLMADFAFVPIDHWNTSTYKLYNVGDNTDKGGRFILGWGTKDDIEYIFYNAKGKDGYIQTYKAPMSLCYFDNESDSTYLEYKEGVRKPRFGLFGDIKFKFFEFGTRKYIFHLRKEDMNIDKYNDIRKH